MNSWTFSLVVAGLPLFAFVMAIQLGYKCRKKRFKTPFTGKLLRPPGESLREEIIRLDDKFAEEFIAFFGACVALGVGSYNVKFQGHIGLLVGMGVLLVVGYSACIYFGFRIVRLGRLRRDYNLGFLGERAVGEELNRMLARGYEVFHDIPFEGRPGSKDFNIDHVIVGPGGLFCIETKTRRKRTTNEADSPRNVVEFDGQRLLFPWGIDDFGINQARENGTLLASWLQKAVGGQIEAIPVLALPGWSVERKGKGDVRVVSGREICSAFPGESGKPVLTPDQVRKIAFQLEQRCRNVEVD